MSAARRWIAAAGALIALALVAGAPAAQGGDDGSASTRASACAGAETPAAELRISKMRRHVRCLINEERAVRGLRGLARDRSLQLASQKHSAKMVETECLAHRCGDEPDLETRLREAGYYEGAESWQFAENTGCGQSPEAMVANWMASRYHRVNILQRSFRELGVGVTKAPVAGRCDRGYATFAIVLGRRVLAD